MKEKILIIEDEEELVKGLKLNLEAEGYEDSWAFDGEEGLANALRDAPGQLVPPATKRPTPSMMITCGRSNTVCHPPPVRALASTA